MKTLVLGIANDRNEETNMSLPGRVVRCLIFLLLFSLPSACDTFRGELHPVAAQTSDAAPYGFPIFLHVPPELAQRELTVSWTGALGGSETYIYPAGEASADLIERTLRGSFSNVLPAEDPSAAERDLPEIVLEGMNIQAALGRPVWKTSSAEVRYRFTLRNRAGDELAGWEVAGFAQRKGELMVSRPPPFFTAVIEQAMSEAAQNLRESLTLYPEVSRALRNLEVERKGL